MIDLLADVGFVRGYKETRQWPTGPHSVGGIPSAGRVAAKAPRWIRGGGAALPVTISSQPAHSSPLGSPYQTRRGSSNGNRRRASFPCIDVATPLPDHILGRSRPLGGARDRGRRPTT